MESITLSPEMLAVIPGIAIVLQLAKSIPVISKLGSWTSLLSVALGIVYAILSKMGVTVPEQIVTGVLMGIAASGGYDTVTALGNTVATAGKK